MYNAARRKTLKGSQSAGYYGLIKPGDPEYVEPWEVLNLMWGIGAKNKSDFIDRWNFEHSRDYGEVIYSKIILDDGPSYPEPVNNLNTPWMEFVLDKRILLIPLRPLVWRISWDRINAVGGAYGKFIQFDDGRGFICRLMKGANSNPNEINNLKTDSSEWSRLINRVHAHGDVDSCDKWAQFSHEDMGTNADDAGCDTWCQEVASKGKRIIHCCHDGRLEWMILDSDSNSWGSGYRPVLEFVRNMHERYLYPHDYQLE